MSILTAVGLTKHYGRKCGLHNLDLQVEDGEIFGLVGPKGAGKTTFINLMMDFIAPTKGIVTLFDMDCQNESREIKKYLGYVPAEGSFYPSMRVYRLLKYAANFYDDVNESYIDNLCGQFRVDVHKRVCDLSYGGLKRLAIVKALMHKPKMIILDEPTLGLDPIMREQLLEALRYEQATGATVFFAASQLYAMNEICTAVGVLQDGQLTDQKSIGKPAEHREKIVKIRVDGDITELIMSLGAKEYMKKDGVVSFLYNSDLNRLLKGLSKFDVEDIYVEDIPLERTLNYYLHEEEEVLA